MIRPITTVCIPTFNRRHWLNRAVASVLSQSFRELELLIVDDASTDDTREFVHSLNDSRVRYYRQKENVGVARNWGTGIDLACGQYVALLMDDDRYDAGFLQHRVDAFQEYPAASLVFSGYQVDSLDGVPIRTHTPSWQDRTVLAGDSFFQAAISRDIFIGATLYRTERLRAVWPQAARFGIIVDWSANIALALQENAPAVYLRETDFLMSEHAGQVSNSRTREVFESAELFLREMLSIAPCHKVARRLRRELSHSQGILGELALSAGDRAAAISLLSRAICNAPFSRTTWRRLLRAAFTRSAESQNAT